jgi:Protein of unknown function (DUF1524)
VKKWTALAAWCAVTAAIFVVVLAGAALAVTHSSARSNARPKWVTTAKQRLARLDTKTAGSMAGYARAKFGRAWEDVDLNRCDTRNDILRRDLRQVVYMGQSKCIVVKGSLDDPYTGATIAFVRGRKTSRAVAIDHVVALAAAWRTGATRWRRDHRLFYANDPLVLLAVDGPTNNAKGDKDAAEWLPPDVAYHCRYVAKQIAVKTKYELWVTSRERATMAQVLAGC